MTKDECVNLIAIKKFVKSLGGRIVYPAKIEDELFRFEEYQTKELARKKECKEAIDNLGKFLQSHA